MTDRPLGAPQGAPASTDDPTRDLRFRRSAPEAPDDPTRDVRLPPLSEHPAAAATPDEDVPARFPTPDVTTVLEPRPEQPVPSAESLRQQTRPFGAPGDLGPAESDPGSASRSETRPPRAAAASVPEPPSRSGGRPWTWVLLAVLPVVIIAVAGVILFLLLGGR
jgi:hypothetical protein